MQSFKKILSIVLAAIMLFCLAVPAMAAPETTTSATVADEDIENAQPEVTAESSDVVKDFINANGRVLSVAKNGNVRKYPANSIEGINNCIELGIDIITVTVQKTKDEKLVLLTDTDLGPYCCNAVTGDAVAGSTTDWNLDELQNTFALRAGKGGTGAEATSYRVASLEEAINAARGKAMIMVDNGFEYASEINTLATSLNACDTVILRGAKSASDIKKFIASATTVCYIAGLYIDDKGADNPSTIDELVAAGVSCVELRSSNKKSSLWSEKTINGFGSKSRAFVSTTDESLCGERQDRTASFESLIGLGVSIIETDYPEDLADYLAEIERYRADLVTLITKVKALETKKYTKDSIKNLENTTKIAEDAVWKGTTTYDQMEEARYLLQEAYDGLVPVSEAEKESMPGWLIFVIVILSIIAILALIVVGLRTYNKIRYRKRDLKEFKDVFQSEVPVENDETLTTNIEEDEESMMGIEIPFGEPEEEPDTDVEEETVAQEDETEEKVESEESTDATETELEEPKKEETVVEKLLKKKKKKKVAEEEDEDAIPSLFDSVKSEEPALTIEVINRGEDEEAPTEAPSETENTPKENTEE